MRQRRRRVLVYAIAFGLAAAAVVTAGRPYRASGSRLHASAFTAAVTGCVDDDAEAVADRQSQPGAQDRCVAIAVHRMSVAVVLLVPLVVLGFLDVRRHVRSRRGIYTGVSYYD